MKYKPYDLGKNQPGKRYMTLAGLINRGWTQDLVEALLREPDKIVKHPRWRCEASVWNIDRVLRAERTSVFVAGRRGATTNADSEKIG